MYMYDPLFVHVAAMPHDRKKRTFVLKSTQEAELHVSRNEVDTIDFTCGMFE